MFVVRSERVVLPDGIRPAAIVIRDGRIAEVVDRLERGSDLGASNGIDAGNRVIFPGIVDTHVHINDPGRARWEGFEHATRAAAAGGVTTLVDMPLNSVPATTTVAGLFAKRVAASDRCVVDVGFWGGVVPGNTDDLEPLARAGVLGFKCFLSPSGVDEFGHVSEADLRAALPVLAALDLPLLAHAEWPPLLVEPAAGSDPRRHETWLASRPSSSEQAAIDLLIRLAEEFRARVHVVHLASADAVPALRAARARGSRITVETCPHYLTFSAEEISDGATAFKCAPPIRSRTNREALWTALGAGDIDLVATDHSPSPPEMKHLDDGDFVKAWGGVASLQIGFSAVWTSASARGVPLERLAEWFCAAPARLAGLDRQKGRIAAGCDADLMILDPDAETVVDPLSLYHRHPITPYAGRTLRGRVHTTLLAGRVVFADGEFPSPCGGRLLGRDRRAGAAAAIA
ncbi:MAG TPA: allantoinase AllB [Vicinamibacterales bacterium]